jgi:hypothetical protein
MDEQSCRRALLAWEVACERLEFALEPPAGMSPATPNELAQAFEVIRKVLVELEAAFSGEHP